MSHFKCTACQRPVDEARYFYTDLCEACEHTEAGRESEPPGHRCEVCEWPLSVREFYAEECPKCAIPTPKRKRSAFEIYEAIGSMPNADEVESQWASEDARRALRVFERDANDAYAWRLSAASEAQRVAFDAESEWAIGVLRKLVGGDK